MAIQESPNVLRSNKCSDWQETKLRKVNHLKIVHTYCIKSEQSKVCPRKATEIVSSKPGGKSLVLHINLDFGWLSSNSKAWTYLYFSDHWLAWKQQATSSGFDIMPCFGFLANFLLLLRLLLAQSRRKDKKASTFVLNSKSQCFTTGLPVYFIKHIL